jgi:hypothetical protein
VPALVRGTLHPLALPEPLVGFVREHESSRVLAVFNLSAAPELVDLADFAAVRPCAECGFAPEIIDRAAILPAHGVLFAEVAPVRERQEEAALAFA